MIELEESKEYINTIEDAEKRGMEKLRESLIEITTWEIEDVWKIFDSYGTLKQILKALPAKEIVKRANAHKKKTWRDIPTDEMTVEQLREAVNELRGNLN